MESLSLIQELSEQEMELIDGGGSNWATYTGQAISSVAGGASVGAFIGGPAGAFVGGVYGGVAYAVGVAADM
ncbi:Blp family class II bacteriocin [Bacillus cereus]|uniref:Blp family class II bacteriocin n=1 Tax=Bacillus cereus group TaxID=86661 RepID=UPI000BECAEC2|nr:Blp family class II bacteriocin [Bacillus toyonensis]PDY85340.1 bacteriocin, lactococcin A1 family protein [Bacillus toyonensis]